ncbi:GntR family transcriptional regulator [Streptomyces sp. NPDC020883]|uniref:GntR family transcriptional regulator n=1 Tax=Streptomyces sp. NPDC020883 TaxID=3365099 RepID=UPI0037941773
MTQTRNALLSDQRRLGRLGGARAASSPAGVANDLIPVTQCIQKWRGLAETRREEAAASPTDQARWDQIIEAVTRPTCAPRTSYEDLVVLISNLRELLKALISAEPPAVRVADARGQLAQQITNGVYPPGTKLSVPKTAAELGLPVETVHMALQDLVHDGVIQAVPNGRFCVPSPSFDGDRPRRLADWLKALIAANVYAVGSPLPPRPQLARALVTSSQSLNEALRLLNDEGILARGRYNRPCVQRRPPNSLLPVCTTRSEPAHEVDLSFTGIKRSARIVHAWWGSRHHPRPSEYDDHVGRLCSAAHHLRKLITSAIHSPAAPEESHLRPLGARMEVTAAALGQPNAEPDLWRAACLSAAVREALGLVETELAVETLCNGAASAQVLEASGSTADQSD